MSTACFIPFHLASLFWDNLLFITALAPSPHTSQPISRPRLRVHTHTHTHTHTLTSQPPTGWSCYVCVVSFGSRKKKNAPRWLSRQLSRDLSFFFSGSPSTGSPRFRFVVVFHFSYLIRRFTRPSSVLVSAAICSVARSLSLSLSVSMLIERTQSAAPLGFDPSGRR